MIYVDSQEHDKVKKNYLSSGIMNCIQGNMINLYNSTKTKISKLGNWTAIYLTNEYKTILCITIYHISQSLTQGIYNLIAQYNQSDAEIKNATQYQREIINEIAEYIALLEYVDDIILVDNLNQVVGSSEI